MKLGIEDRVAIVCGSSKGIGYAAAQALGLEGVRVLLIARNQNTLGEAKDRLAGQGVTAEILVGDVSDPRLPQLAVAKCNAQWGKVDILVNNAGGPPMGSILEHDEEAWQSAMETNFHSVKRFCQAVLPDMRNNCWGRIVTVTSTVSKEPSPAMVLSATARAGVSVLMKTIAQEFAADNITANSICPGGVLTERLVSLIRERAAREGRPYEDLLAESQKMIPANRFAQPAEIADVIVFLASDRGGYVNGVSLSVDGGLTKAYN
jgi:3-oxoacyl-[acyl-carrier protein] reductase